jgi:hypothetical protein
MNLKSERLSIEETDHVEKRRERSEEARQKAFAEQSEVSERVQKLESEKEANAMASLADQQRLYGLPVLLALVLFVADWPIQYGLNSVAFTSLSWPVLAMLAVLVAAGLGVVVEVAAFAMFFDAYRPRRTVRLCLTAAGISGALAAIAGTVLLFSRTATGQVVDFLAQAVPVSMWALGECLPVTAGFLSAAAWTLGYPKRRDDRIDGLKGRLSELGRFLDWLDRDKQKLVGRVVTMLLFGFLLAAPVFCQGGYTPPTGTIPLATAAPANGSPHQAPGKAKSRCLVAVDMTTSVDSDYRRTAVSLFTQSVLGFVTAFQCTVLVAGTFADEGPYIPLSEFEVPLEPLPGDCSNATFAADGMERITQSISGFQAYYRRRAEEACRAKLQARRTDFNQKAQELAKQIGTVLNPDLPTRGQCTAIFSLLSWAMRRNNVLVLLTDGVETCDQQRSLPRVPEQTRVVLVLLPPHMPTRSPGHSAAQLVRFWENGLPGSVVVMPSEVNAGLWRELSTRPR